MLSFRIQMKSRIFGSKLAQHAEHSPWNAWILFDVSVVAIARKKTSHQIKDHRFVECFSTWAIQEGCPSKTIHTSTTCLESEHYHFNIPQPKLTAYHNQISNHSMFEKPLLSCVWTEPAAMVRQHGAELHLPCEAPFAGKFFRENAVSLGWRIYQDDETPKSSKIRENWISIWMPLRSSQKRWTTKLATKR